MVIITFDLLYHANSIEICIVMKYYYDNFAIKRKRKPREYAAAEIYTRIISNNNFITLYKNVEWRVWKADRSKK